MDVRDSAAVQVALGAAALIKVQAIISDPPGISSNIKIYLSLTFFSCQETFLKKTTKRLFLQEMSSPLMTAFPLRIRFANLQTHIALLFSGFLNWSIIFVD